MRPPAALEQVLARCQDLRLTLDGVERPIRRPKSAQRQRACYSGRKKRHTVKNLIVEEKRSVKFLSPTAPGSQHDKALAEPLETVTGVPRLVPPSLNWTVPAALDGLTVAVSVTLLPVMAGFALAVSVVVVLETTAG